METGCSLASIFLVELGVQHKVPVTNAVVQDNAEAHLVKTPANVAVFLLLCKGEKVYLHEVRFDLKFCRWL